MLNFSYKDLSTPQQIHLFYEILECADRDNRYEIDNEYMNIILTEIRKIAATYPECQSFDLEYLAQQIEQRPDDHEYSAEELDSLYEVLSSLRYNLLKAHNIEMPLFY